MAKGHGGKREGAGRKPRAEEQKIIERLSPLDNKAYNALSNALDQEKSWAVKMYYEYVFGKPKETKDVNLFTEQPVFSD